jgi:hypothetical protein
MFILPNFSLAQIKRTPIINKTKAGFDPTKSPLDPCLVEVQAIPNLSSGENTGSLNLRSNVPNDKDKVLKTSEETKPWIHFDLGSVQKLKKVRFKPEIAANQQKSYFLLYSSDMPLDQSLSSVSYRSESVTLNGTDFIELNNIEARYIKIQLIEDIPQSLALSGIQFLAACGPTPTPEDGKCDNGGFERGDFTGWTAESGIRTVDGSILQNVKGFLPNRHQILSLPIKDPIVSIGSPCSGSFVARLGEPNVAGAGIERLSYTFTVDNTNADFFFRYAFVLNDGGHPLDRQAYFQYKFYKIENGSKIEIPELGKKIIAEENNPYFTKIGSILYKNWTCERKDLSTYIGKTMVVEYTNADCSEGVHYAYTYIDGICTTIKDNAPVATIVGASSVCSDPDYVYSGTTSCGGNRYTWKLAKVNTKFVQNVAFEDFIGLPSTINILDFCKKNNVNIEFNTTYRLTLIVGNDCSESTVTKDIFISNRELVKYKDIAVCSGYTGTIAMQGEINTCEGCTYYWSPSYKFENPTSPFAYLKPQFAQCGTTVTVYATTANGCVSTDQVKIYPINSNILSISKDVDYSNVPKSQFCNYDINAKVNTECLPIEFLKVKLTTEADPTYVKFGELTNNVSNAYNYNFKIPQSLGNDLVNSSDKFSITIVPISDFLHVYGDGCFPTLTSTLENRFWYWGYFNLQNKFIKGFLPVKQIDYNNADGPGIAMNAWLAPIQATLNQNRNFTASHIKGHGMTAFWRKIEIFSRWGNLVRSFEESAGLPTITLHNRFPDSRYYMWDGNLRLIGYINGEPEYESAPTGTYTWHINLENCTRSRTEPIKEDWKGSVDKLD